MEYNNYQNRQIWDTMDKNTSEKFIAFLKHPAFPFLLGLGVTCIHFMFTSMLETVSIMRLILITPGYVPMLILESSSSLHQFNDSFGLHAFIVNTISALFYGIVAGFLVSRKGSLQLTAIILLSLALIFACLLLIIIAPTYA
jgi:hypothetical protein